MKHITAPALLVLVILAGCAVTQQAVVPTEQPELISIASLPPLNMAWYAGGMKLNVLMHIQKDGTIDNAVMIGSSGDPEWDSLALQSIRQWRYATPRRDGTPTDVWVRQMVVVQVQEPVMMTIGELAFPSPRDADSLFTLIEKGVVPDSLFRQTQGSVDIMKYPRHVREELKMLREDEVTHPIRVGDNYVIYKRFPKTASRVL